MPLKKTENAYVCVDVEALAASPAGQGFVLIVGDVTRVEHSPSFKMKKIRGVIDV